MESHKPRIRNTSTSSLTPLKNDDSYLALDTNKYNRIPQSDLKLVISGLESIIKLDKILKAKSTSAKTLKFNRLERDGVLPSHDSDNEFDDDYSCISCFKSETMSEIDFEKNVKTFLTEAKLKRMAHNGWVKNVPQPEQSINSNSIHKRGDFITRNKLLGPDARFYDALTLQEKQRVQEIVDQPDEKIESLGFSLEQTDYSSLTDIDKSLQDLVPQSQWQSKSISLAGTGFQTPATYDGGMASARNVDAVLQDVDGIKDSNVFLKNEMKMIKEIDEKLDGLKELEERPITREEIEKLIFESLEYDQELRLN